MRNLDEKTEEEEPWLSRLRWQEMDHPSASGQGADSGETFAADAVGGSGLSGRLHSR